jgi:hypothetical protein
MEGGVVRWAVVIVGLMLDFVGAIWLLQGLNILGGSPMTGDPIWAIAGLVALALGITAGVLALRSGTEDASPQ